MKLSETERVARGTLRVTLRLSEDVLGSEGKLFRLDYAEQPPADEEGVIRRAVVGRVFFHGDAVSGGCLECWGVGCDLPAEREKLPVDAGFPRQPLGFIFREFRHSGSYIKSGGTRYERSELFQVDFWR